MADDIFNPSTDLAERNKEWVTLSNGKRLCVWEMTVADRLQVLEHCTLPEGVPGAIRYSRGEAIIWRMMRSCYTGDDANARPIFNEDNLLSLYRLRDQDGNRILDAMDRVNASDTDALERLEAFTPVPAAEPTGTRSSSVSSSSTGSPASSPTSEAAS
jgi:hypothetical protein